MKPATMGHKTVDISQKSGQMVRLSSGRASGVKTEPNQTYDSGKQASCQIGSTGAVDKQSPSRN